MAASGVAGRRAPGGTVAQLARAQVDRCRELTLEINSLERELRDLVRELAPSLLAVPGCGVLGAAMLVGETAGARRFRSKDAYARFTGTPQFRSGRVTAAARSGSTAAATAPSW